MLHKSISVKSGSRGFDAIPVNLPETDAEWIERCGSVEARDELARQQLVVKIQAEGRKHLSKGEEAVTKACAAYRYKGGSGRPILDAAEIPGITRAQIRFFEEEKGYIVINQEAATK